MTAHNDHLDFDQTLTQGAGDLPPPPRTAAAVTPWYRAMTYLLWGLALTTITLPVVQLILPPIGALLLCQGLRILQAENRYFSRALRLSLGYAGWYTLMALIWATPANTADGLALFLLNTLLMVTRYLLLLALCIQLRRGLKQALYQREVSHKRDPLLWLIVFYVTYLIYAGLTTLIFFNIQYSAAVFSFICTLAFMLWFFCILHRIWTAAMLLEGEGYQIRATPIRVSGLKMGVIWLGCAAALAGVLMISFSRFPVPSSPAPAAADTQPNLQQRLLDLGFPQHILDDLDGEELSRYHSAQEVLLSVRQTSEAQGGKLELTTLTVVLAEDTVRVLNHYRWLAPPSYRAMEGLEVSIPQRYIAATLYSDPAGRCLFDREGQTWQSPLYAPKNHPTPLSTYTASDGSPALYAEFSLPVDGENLRGYLGYSFRLTRPDSALYFNTMFRYTRLALPLNYPWYSPVYFMTHPISIGGWSYHTAEALGESHVGPPVP